MPVTRKIWTYLTSERQATLVVFECVVPDPEMHRYRAESRQPDLPRQAFPTWQDVVGRDFVAWDER